MSRDLPGLRPNDRPASLFARTLPALAVFSFYALLIWGGIEAFRVALS